MAKSKIIFLSKNGTRDDRNADNLHIPWHKNLYQLAGAPAPHFHAIYGGQEVLVSIRDIEVLDGSLPNKQLKMLLGWAAFHQDELLENWALAEQQQELFPIDPLK